MKQVRFEFEELPYETLSQFGLTREMIEDLPMHILEELSHGRHSPVLPIKVNDDNGNTVTDRSRFASAWILFGREFFENLKAGLNAPQEGMEKK